MANQDKELSFFPLEMTRHQEKEVVFLFLFLFFFLNPWPCSPWPTLFSFVHDAFIAKNLERHLWLSNRTSRYAQQLALVCACHMGRSVENLELKLDVEWHPEACKLAWGELGRSAEKRKHAIEAKCMGSMRNDSSEACSNKQNGPWFQACKMGYNWA